MRITDDLEIKLRELSNLMKKSHEEVLRSLIGKEYEEHKYEAKEISGVYKITCLINNKVYIGKSKHILKRWKEHESGTDASRKLRDAVENHGLDNFSFEVIEENYDEKECGELELEYILKYRSYNPKYGYNATIPEFMVGGFNLDIAALIEKRKQKGLEQNVLASRLGINEDQLIKIEKGKRLPSKALLLMISDELNCSVDELVIKEVTL